MFDENNITWYGKLHVNYKIPMVHRRAAREEAERNGEDPDEAAAAVEAAEPEEEEQSEVRYAVRSGPYELCRKAGLGKLNLTL